VEARSHNLTVFKVNPTLKIDVGNAMTVGTAFGCEAWLSDHGAFMSLALGGLSFTISAILFTLAEDLPRLAPTIATFAFGKQHLVPLGIVVLAPAVLVTDSRWRADAPHLYEMIELTGVLMIAICVLGRSWCQHRPLSHPRPALVSSPSIFLFTCLGAAGVAAQSGGLLLTLMGFLAGTFIFSPLPKLDSATSQFGRSAIDHTALLFAAIPLADLTEALQAAGHLPVLLRLP
jgi:hypothetical protein